MKTFSGDGSGGPEFWGALNDYVGKTIQVTVSPAGANHRNVLIRLEGRLERAKAGDALVLYAPDGTKVGALHVDANAIEGGNWHEYRKSGDGDYLGFEASGLAITVGTVGA